MGSNPPRGLRWRSSTLFIISTVGIGLFTDLALYGLIVPILPFILQDRVHIPHKRIQSDVSGLLAAYAGASVLFSPVAGWLADKLPNRRLPFLTGLFALLLSTALLFVGATIPVLVVARIFQGISAAVVWTIGLALTLDTVGSANLGKTIGSIFGFISVGELVAPVLGGVVYDKSGSPGVFAMGFGLLAVDFLLRLLVIEKKVAAKWLGDEAFHQENSQSDDEQSDTEEDPLIKREEDTYKISENQPKLVKTVPVLYLLSDPRILTAELVALLQATLLASFDATIPTVAEQYFGFNALKASLLFIPLVLPYLLLGPVAGWLVDRYGVKPSAVGGYTFLVPILILTRVVQPGGSLQIGILCTLLALCGLGFAAIGSPSIVEVAQVVQQYDEANPGFFGENGPYASIYGINSMVFSLGLTIGPLLSGSLKTAIGYGNMNLVLAVLCLGTALLSMLYLGGQPKFYKSLKKRIV